jgi:hypothetical protein
LATAKPPSRYGSDEFHHGGPGLDPRERQAKRPTAHDIRIPGSPAGSVKVATRDFRWCRFSWRRPSVSAVPDPVLRPIHGEAFAQWHSIAADPSYFGEIEPAWNVRRRPRRRRARRVGFFRATFAGVIAQALERPSDAVVRSTFVERLETGVKRGIIDRLVPADNFVAMIAL